MSSDMRGMVPLSVSSRASLSLLNIQNMRLLFLFRYAIKHQSVKSNGYPFIRLTFSRHEYDLVWNRDYSLRDGMFRLNTLSGRLKVPLNPKAWSIGFPAKAGLARPSCFVKTGNGFRMFRLPWKKRVLFRPSGQAETGEHAGPSERSSGPWNQIR